MLGIGCPDRHALPFTHSPPPPKRTHRHARILPRERVRSWVGSRRSFQRPEMARGAQSGHQRDLGQMTTPTH